MSQDQGEQNEKEQAMMICRMLSPGLLAALMHAESWVECKDHPKSKAAQSDNFVSGIKDEMLKQKHSNNSEYVSRTEQDAIRSMFLS